jgi:predicted ATPase/class 3 adenylate cyclase
MRHWEECLTRDHRRLAAIVLADVAGYSRLMGRDESGTLAALKTHRRELIDPAIAECGGRIVKTTGDGLLLEFRSALDAVSCAVDVQRGMAERNADVPAESRIDFRIGINIGDIIIDGDDIFGDGVNVAARLETLAESGGICISGKVYSEVADKLDCQFEDRGLQRVKNIALPIRVYALGLVPKGTSIVADVVRSPVSEEKPRLYGRAEDLSALRSLIEQNALITVVGPGGIGKTRLVEAVVHDLRDRFPERVLVELAPLADPALVVGTVARALGLVVGDARTALDLTVQALAGQRLLLVLDNCEHLLEAVDHVVAALHKGAPDVHILATSQELLRHPDEHVYRLGALALPAEATVSGAREAGAVELFVVRAQAVEPRFLLSDDNVGAVVEICQRLDGIPLAIELAAARVPLLGVEGVRERLNERFRLLTAGSRLALRRHQTLRAALEWSYSLLSEPEQAVFDKLGVFAGSFSLKSAQKLAADDRMDEWAVLEHLGALVDKSLVSVDAGRTARYRMLETTRAFALERLAARGATSQAMRRHAEVMLDLFERFYHELLQGASPAKGAEQLAPDLDNLRSALRWASEADGDRRIAIALFGAAGAGHEYLNQVEAEAWEWCKMLRPLVDSSIAAADAARFWLACAEWGGVQSPVASVEDAKRAIVLYRDLDDRVGSYLAWTALAYALTMAGQLDEARRALIEPLKLRDPAWTPWLRCLVDNIALIVFSGLGALSEAREHALAYLSVTRQGGSTLSEWVALSLLVDLDVAAGNAQQAATAASELLARRRASPETQLDCKSVRLLATALMSADRLEEAETVYREALPLVRRTYGTGAIVLYDAAMLLARRGRIDDAARVWSYAEHVFAAEGRFPRLVARQIRERLLALLAAERPSDTLSRLYDEGRRLTDDQACALAFPPLAPRA